MTEQLQTIGIVAQLGLGGVMLIVAGVIFRSSQRWLNEQQARADAAMKVQAEQSERLVTVVMAHQTEQMIVVRETAKFLHDTSANMLKAGWHDRRSG